MPSITHEVLAALFRERPSLACELVSRMGVELPPTIDASISSAEFTELEPAEYRADAVVKLDDANGKAAAAIIVEVQLRRDVQKRISWPLYMAGLRARLDGCGATVLVVTLDDGVATWAAQPILLDHNGSVMHPLVVGPRQLPRITDFDQAHGFPELSVLSAAAHAAEEDAPNIALAAMMALQHLDNYHSTRYADFVKSSLDPTARRALERLMSLHNYEFQTEFAKRYMAEGRKEGREAGERAIVLRQLMKRFGPLPAAAVERVEQADVATVEEWAERLLTAETLDQVFTG